MKNNIKNTKNLSLKIGVDMNSKQRTIIRRRFGVHRNTSIPVKIVPTSLMPPLFVGSPGGWYTRGGRKIFYPSAYAKKGWSNMMYICSSEEIWVGERWLKTVNYEE